MTDGGEKGGLAAWCALLRLPNLFTVPGDVVVGYLIGESLFERIDIVLGYSFSTREFASLAFFPALGTVLSLYCFGLVSNDLADTAEDLRDRPNRPLPSGAISEGAAKLAAFVLLLAGLISAKLASEKVFLLACVLAAAIAGYNFYLKRFSFLGPLTLAACRVLALLTGFFASEAGCFSNTPPPFLILTCVIWGAYVFALSAAARNETNPKRKGKYEKKIVRRIPHLQLFWLITAMFLGGGVAALEAAGELPPALLLALALTMIFIISTLRPLSSLTADDSDAETAQGSVGALVRGLIFLQASACAFLGYPYAAVAVGALWIPAKLASKLFKGS
ncbi:MAG: UbiA family prenyltransferase [Victivallales bacterium]|nr:UbiA family prenyltransferase [Victivallales bacterium]